MELEHLFNGSALNGVDAKGRLSVPAFIRAMIERRSPEKTIVLGKHETENCLVGYDAGYKATFSKKSAAAACATRSRASTSVPIMPAPAAPSAYRSRSLRQFRPHHPAPDDAQDRRIEDLVLFVGAGETFELWNPKLALASGDPGSGRSRGLPPRRAGRRLVTAARPAAHPRVARRGRRGARMSPGETHVDGTFGAGGYSRRSSQGVAPGHRLRSRSRSDRRGKALVAESEGRLTLSPIVFRGWARRSPSAASGRSTASTLDIGVSSMQLDQAERGFSFQTDGPLDMRMGHDGLSAADFVNTADEAEIADVLFHYGEEPRIAPRRPRHRRRPADRTTGSWPRSCARRSAIIRA